MRVKIETEEEKQKEHGDITEAYLVKLFKTVPKNESLQDREKRLELLNEYLSDQFLDQLSALLTKQYMEKDAYLKLILIKYMEQGLAESSAIKT